MDKVLIVDDNQQILRMHQKILQHEGFEVDIATDGKTGLEKAILSNPSIILLDIMMPELDGMQVLEKLRTNDKTKNIPVIMLTNLSDKNIAEEAVKKGANKYIIKGDSDPSIIATMIKEVLDINN